MSKKSIYIDKRREFYLTFFGSEEGYEEKEVNGFWLIKHWDGNSKKWIVDLYSLESFEKYKLARERFDGMLGV